MGRIGLDWSLKNPNMVLAIIDTDKTGMGLTPAKGYIGVSLANTKDGVQISTLPEKSPAVEAKLASG